MTKSRNICSVLIIFSIAFLSYFNTFTNSFHFDDFRYILHNVEFKEYIQQPFSVNGTLSNLSNRSIVLATLRLNHSLDGFNVFGFHVVNLTIHITTCLLILLFAKEVLQFNKTLKTEDRNKSKLNIPLISALLFAVHPMNTQAVTYVTGRTTSLAVCFYIASFLFFIKGVRKNLPYKILFYAFSIAFLIVGYGSKMIILTAPVMFFVFYLFFTPQNSFFQKSAFLNNLKGNKVTAVIAQAAVLSSPFILFFLSQFLNFKAEDIVSPNSLLFSKLPKPFVTKLYFITTFTRDIISSSIYLLTEFKVIVFYYIKMIFFPFNQNIDPDFPVAHGITDPGVMLSLSVILLCLFAGIYFYKKNRLIAFGIFWFFITLLPTSSVLPLLDTVTEHRMYLPLAGFSLTIPLYLNQFVMEHKKSSFKQLTYFILLIFFLIIVFSLLTVRRNFVWKDEKSLWSDAAEKSPQMSRPFNNLGEAFDKEKNYEKAIPALKKAISISPTYYKSYNNLGKIYGKLGQFDPAIKNLKLALKYKPHYPIGHYNLGKIYDLKGMLDDAIEEYSTAFKQQEAFFEACFNLANVYDKKGQHKKALDTYFICRKFKPSFPKIYFAIGNIFIKTGNLDAAFKYYSRTVELDSNYLSAEIAMANLFVMKKNFGRAVEVYRKVIKSDPNNFNIHNHLGLVFLQHLDNPSQADYHFKKSLEINPEQQKAVLLRELIKKISEVRGQGSEEKTGS
tara:strand:+ start:6195 stop:8378 length:2184 start_codon:yes stop_codon:yes gene_type:complete